MRLISKKNLLFIGVASLAFSCAHSPEPAEKEEKPRQVDQEQAPKLSSSEKPDDTEKSNSKPEAEGPKNYIELESGERLSFETGEWVYYEMPSPSYQPVYAVWHSSEGEFLQKTQAYHGWDINLDGELDMFEGIDIDGVVHTRFYDYDFDGVIDETISAQTALEGPETEEKTGDLETLEVGDASKVPAEKEKVKLETIEVKESTLIKSY